MRYGSSWRIFSTRHQTYLNHAKTAQIYQHKRILPLFAGKEAVTKAQQVQGIQVKKTGYSDFYQLWVGDQQQG